ncbi:MAG: hypothetical protein PHX38_00730 [Sulfuricella sp.]|nr:hypothetical protein [Sulfuricella sp.]
MRPAWRSLVAAIASALAVGLHAQDLPAPEPAGAAVIGDIQLTQIRLDEAARLISQVGRTNVVVTGKVADQVASLYLRSTTVEDMVRNLCRAAGVWFRYDAASKTYVIMSGPEYQKDLAIVRDEKTRVFTLRHHNVVATANAVKALFGARVNLSLPVEETPAALGSPGKTAAGGANQATPSAGVPANPANSSMTGGATLDTGPAAQPSSAFNRASGGAGQGGGNYDPAQDLGRLGQDRIESQLRADSQGRGQVNIADIQDMVARQGPTIYLSYNKLNNLLLVRSGDGTALTQIAELIGEMDRPPRQVLLEMQILEASLDDGFKSVFDIGTSGRTDGFTGNIKGITSGPLPVGALSLVTPDGSTVTGYGRNVASSGNFAAEQDATFVWQLMSDTLRLRIQLLAKENKLKTLASPMLVAANNQPARLFIGDERVLVTGASTQTITGTTGASNTNITAETERRNVGQTLSILPRINGDRSVSLTIDQDSSTVKIGDTSIPIATASGEIVKFPIDTVATANLQVTAHAYDGMTVAVGGMIRENLDRQEAKVPLLGDIPGLGILFKRDVRTSSRSQIVLLITPRVLESPEESSLLAARKTRSFNELTSGIPAAGILPKLPAFERTAPQP